MFGMLPAYGFFIRHARGIELNNVEVGFMKEDRRPAFVLESVKSADFQHVKAQKAGRCAGVRAAQGRGLHGSRRPPITPDAWLEKERKEM
jgi:hypothetical protein